MYHRSWLEQRLSWLIVAFALVNGVLYALLLPLWEGFDEPFHYGYVQELSTRSRIPALGRTNLSREIWDSLLLVPVSHVVQRNIPALRTFESYFSLPPSTRSELRQHLENLPPHEKYEISAAVSNYEAQQAPLAYLVLALPDRLLSETSLLTRVRTLRMVSVVLAILLTAGAATALCTHLKLGSPFRELVLFLTFSSQMFYAATAHICNDWLAVPLASWLIVAAIRSYLNPGVRSTANLALILSLGLLTKAYFLALVPLFPAVLACTIVRRRLSIRATISGIAIAGVIAGPWYLRNLSLYGSLSGMQENIAGVDIRQLVRAVPDLPWAASAAYTARAVLWTGNNQFNTFSRGTLNAMLILLGVSAYYYLLGLRKEGQTVADAVTLATTSLFIMALAYYTAVSFAYTHGASAGASPWYVQVLLMPVLALTARGLSRAGRAGSALGCAEAVLWSYVMLATYFIKLVPQYSGYNSKLNHIADLAGWYFHGAIQRCEMLRTTTLAPPLILYTLLAAVGLSSIMIAAAICRMLWHNSTVEHVCD